MRNKESGYGGQIKKALKRLLLLLILLLKKD